ncbi:hypothetical protein FSP39_019942 [Pinctada imbricata]|uniref:Uncharacterized protein n=1 Tax=Pinctada imbricata TaxID=66713 RepID=A0AA88Y3A0_PINIB|nr:hypothetical protein FSP39_019942 [Pinctada imbricata]
MVSRGQSECNVKNALVSGCRLVKYHAECPSGDSAVSVSDEQLDELQSQIDDIRSTIKKILKIPSILIPDAIEDALKGILKDLDRAEILTALHDLQNLFSEKFGFVSKMFDSLFKKLTGEAQALQVRYNEVTNSLPNIAYKPSVTFLAILTTTILCMI